MNKTLPMHMPGHKRNAKAFPELAKLGMGADFTEIKGTDDLHHPTGMLAEAMERAAALWGAKKSFFLVNGSTGGILSAIRCVTTYGDTVVVARNCHRSVFNAIELCGLNPVSVMPEYADEYGFFGSVPPEVVEAALDKHPKAKAVIVTSPTYEGVISDMKAICRICHEKDVVCIADEAHGAHLDLSPHFKGGSVKAGADIVVQSLHKTLPALTQTAVLHLNSGGVDETRLRRQLAIFQTSSPSYPLLASADFCVRALENKKLLDKWALSLDVLESECMRLKNIHLFSYSSCMFARDRSKVLITHSKRNTTGVQIADALRQKGIEPEMTTERYVLAMTGAGDTENSIRQLARALLEIDEEFQTSNSKRQTPNFPISLPHLVMPPSKALKKPYVMVPITETEGKTAAEYIWSYPPGIPLIIPGESVTAEFIGANHDNLRSDNTSPNNKIKKIAVLTE